MSGHSSPWPRPASISACSRTRMREIAPGLEVRPLRHRIETYGYRLTEPDGRTMLPERLAAAGITGPDAGRLQRDGVLRGVRLEDVSIPRAGQGFAFIMDTAPCEGAEGLADGVDLLVAESTFSDDDAALAAQYAHLTAGQAGIWRPTAAPEPSCSPTFRPGTATWTSWPSRPGHGPEGPPSYLPTIWTGSAFPSGSGHRPDPRPEAACRKSRINQTCNVPTSMPPAASPAPTWAGPMTSSWPASSCTARRFSPTTRP